MPRNRTINTLAARLRACEAGKRYSNGESVEELAEAFGIGVERMRLWIDWYDPDLRGVMGRRASYTPNDQRIVASRDRPPGRWTVRRGQFVWVGASMPSEVSE